MNAVYCRTCEAVIVGDQHPLRLSIDHEVEVHPESQGTVIYERLST